MKILTAALCVFDVMIVAYDLQQIAVLGVTLDLGRRFSASFSCQRGTGSRKWRNLWINESASLNGRSDQGNSDGHPRLDGILD